MKLYVIVLLVFFFPAHPEAQPSPPEKPRVIISTDIGGTDDDDFQSMIHFLMYSNQFQTEGLISSPSYGDGSTKNILDMIALYEKDLPKLKRHADGFPTADELRKITKQGRRGPAPYAGYATATEGSDWMITCARRKSTQPLWILVWGGLEDLAQALHDAPDIQSGIKVYWIGGPNKKWSTNSYTYIVTHFPNLWFIEDNSSYRGFFADKDAPDDFKNKSFYNKYISGAGYMGRQFGHYYNGEIKMGDTPSLLYVMSGDPDHPGGESWGGSFSRMGFSPRKIFYPSESGYGTAGVYSIIEFRLNGKSIRKPAGSVCFTLTVTSDMGQQEWPGYYLGHKKYGVRYVPKKSETIDYKITSDVSGLNGLSGVLKINNIWPGNREKDDYAVGDNWYSDKTDTSLFKDGWQGAETVFRYREEVLKDWAERWNWLK